MLKSLTHLRLAYILISVIMFLPVLLWPVPILLSNNPMLPEALKSTWFLSAVLLLTTAVCMDTILYGISSIKQAIDATLWITLFSIIAVSALQNQHNIWIISILFLTHALRSANHLLNTQKTSDMWWLWLAWSRDMLAAVSILIWCALWSIY